MADLDLLSLIKLLVKTLLLPPGGLLVLLLLGLTQWRARPRFALVLLIFGVSLLWLSATPVVASAYEEWASNHVRVLDLKRAQNAQAIVIPAGGLRPSATEYGGITLGRLTLERVRYGAYLAKATQLPVLVTGGSGMPPATEGELMKTALETEFGVAVRWMENRSENTRENAAESARLLRPLDPQEGVRRIVLVAHGFDMRRAKLEFEAVGFEVIPAPTQVAKAQVLSVSDVLPQISALERTHYVSYELLALGVSASGLQ